MPAVRPLRDLLYVRRVKREKTAGGILIPAAFDHHNKPSLRVGAVPDYFEAEILAMGPEVREVTVGAHVLVKTWAGTDKRALYAGEAIDDQHLFVRYPDDLIGALDLEENGLQVNPEVV